ncbi:unnamed protein product [Brassica rapa]|uniref:DUF223 domain-containing protein n=1 Tax=Brassica campestris TaxID=3711 RepID=A0A8D9DAE5_BRACM|nr:unnamed protein product [Brassica rapa]
MNNQLYFDFKNIHEIPHIRNMDINYPIDTMGVVFNTEAHFDDHKRPKMVFYIRDNIQIKCVATGHHAYAFREGFQNMGDRGEVIVILKMWRSIDILHSNLVVQLLYLISESLINPFGDVIVILKLQHFVQKF